MRDSPQVRFNLCACRLATAAMRFGLTLCGNRGNRGNFGMGAGTGHATGRQPPLAPVVASNPHLSIMFTLSRIRIETHPHLRHLDEAAPESAL